MAFLVLIWGTKQLAWSCLGARESIGCIAALVTAPASLRPVLLLSTLSVQGLSRATAPLRLSRSMGRRWLWHYFQPTAGLGKAVWGNVARRVGVVRCQLDLLGFPGRKHWAETLPRPHGMISEGHIIPVCVCMVTLKTLSIFKV